MNFYKHHLGDYAKDTSHLSWMEDMAYTKAIRSYYLREKPLPADRVECDRLLRAVTRREKEAVTRVLSEFFVLLDDGYHNKRCDEEIEQYQAQAATNRRIARQRIVNESSTNRPPATVQEREPNQKPEPEANNQKEKSIVGLAPDAAPQKKNGRVQYRPQALEILAFLNEKCGSSFEPVAVNLERIEARLKEGADYWDIRAVIAKKCREWAADEKMRDYLRPATLFGREKFWQYHGQLEKVA